MKKIFFSICFPLFTLVAHAQDLQPVKWSARTIQEDNAQFVVVQAAIDKPWHIFTNFPGGDGFAIPTALVLVNGKDSISITDRMANMKPITHNIEGMGVVNYFEGTLVYKLLLTQPLSADARLLVTYQTCNDKMCLPPTDIELRIPNN
jgi:hypothetical protein